MDLHDFIKETYLGVGSNFTTKPDRNDEQNFSEASIENVNQFIQ